MYFLKRLTKSDTIFNKTELDQGKLWKKIGRKGQGRGQFDMPCGVTTTKSGDVIIADTENHRVQIFNFDGVFKSKFGSKGSKPSQLCYPMGVAVTSSEDVVVTDSVNAAIKLFSIDGTLKMCFTQQAAVEFPHGICVTIDDHIIFTDICKHSVTVLQPNGTISHIFGKYGDGPQEFDHPYCVTTNSSNQIIVSDTGNNCVKIFHFQGRLLRCFTSLDFHLPSENFVSLFGVCTDSDDNTLVVCNSGVYILTKNGRLWEVLTSDDGLTTPKCIAFSQGRLIVTQSGYDVKHEVCIYRYNKDDFKSLNTLLYYAISI
ncbi:tripartite motif-containing protein 2-like [Biomphalaria glabrata]|uniref:Tripartite motif-containing protein 2-like n=1 Tax=Biomphalaria glabrata TaxID=6526 RepID=A0A2C9M703_BIOGL|nr:tripartite motif-containing protein 2-like [Biomphalaria glabrata]KAI8778531.1 tripartite motif-containing protein 2 [Biomphalaria glabrata]